MISFAAYKVLHLIGVFMVIAGLAARPVVGWVGGGGRGMGVRHPAQRLASATHGGGLLIVLVAGFGMLARAGWSTAQFWVLAKLVVWLLLGALIALAGRKPEKAATVWFLTFLLAGFSAYFAIYKP